MKKKPKYYKPPMKFNVAHQKYEPDLPSIKKTDNKNEKFEVWKLILILVLIAIGAAFLVIFLRNL